MIKTKIVVKTTKMGLEIAKMQEEMDKEPPSTSHAIGFITTSEEEYEDDDDL